MTSVLEAGRRHWRDHWEKQTTPQHAVETEEDYQELAAELRLLFAGVQARRVLEVGCGDGALFPYLGFGNVSRYLGIDFSASMIARFRARFPGIDVVAADAPGFVRAEKFDLVFSSHVVQYWDRDQLTSHLHHARSMVDDGLVVLAGVPWARMRLAYGRGDLTGGDLTGGRRRSLSMAALSAVHELLIPDIGHWYEFQEFSDIAATQGLRATFRGSGYYPYRFHAILRPGSQ